MALTNKNIDFPMNFVINPCRSARFPVDFKDPLNIIALIYGSPWRSVGIELLARPVSWNLLNMKVS